MDTSRNNGILAAITLGEGWHNNHHRHPSSTRNGLHWWEWDATYYTLRALKTFGIVWGFRRARL
jgi:stearoyl-CoA desaturase (delta-9 desaturase)